MTEQPTEHPSDLTELDPWQVFETRLNAYVSTMIDPADEDALVLHVPWTGGEEPAEVRVCVRDRAETLWVDYAWDGVGGWQALRDDFVHRLCDTIRYRYDLSHPQLMTVSATGPAAGGVGVLGLSVHRTSALAYGEACTPLAWPQSHDELQSLVLGHLQRRCDFTVKLDDDGDIPILVDDVGLWVGPQPDSPTIRLFTRVVAGVGARRQADTEVNVLNRQHRWSRWVRRDREIWQELHVPASPFVPELLDTMIDGFVGDFLRVRDDLAARVNGEAGQ